MATMNFSVPDDVKAAFVNRLLALRRRLPSAPARVVRAARVAGPP